MNYKQLISYLLLILLIPLTSCSQPPTSEQSPLTRTKYKLGTKITVKIYDQQNKTLLTKIFQRIDQIEETMSADLETSELNKINSQAGRQAVKVSAELYHVLTKAKDYAKLSQGAYDPTIGPLVELWNISGDNPQVPKKETIQQILPYVNYNQLQLLPDRQVKLAREKMKLDLGGIAKGYAADEINQLLADHNVQRAIINLGGNIYLRGKKNSTTKWRIGIQNPFQARGSYLGIIRTFNRAVVSSGDYERYFRAQGKKYHHILNHKTGYPVRNQVKGVTIIAPQAIDADALSTALFVLGVDAGLNLVETLKDIEALYITKDRRVFLSSGLKDNFELTNNRFTLVNP